MLLAEDEQAGNDGFETVPDRAGLFRAQIIGDRKRQALNRAGRAGGELAGRVLGRVRERGKTLNALGAAAMAGRGEGIDDAAAANRRLGRLVAQDQPVVSKRADRPVEDDLGEGAVAGGEAVAFEQRDPAHAVSGGEMDMDGRPVAERLFLAAKQIEANVDHRGRRVDFGGERPIAAIDLVLAKALSRQCSSAQRSPALARSAGRF